MKKIYLVLFALVAVICSVNAQYKVGDIYDKDGVKGMVVTVDDSGEHGLLLSLRGTDDRWCKGDIKTAIGAVDENDGAVNLETVKNYIASKGLSIDDFPLFKWVEELGEGWYIPSKNELLAIAENLNGGSLDKYNQKSLKQYDKILKKNDGKGIILNGMAKSNDFLSMDSSTECAGNMIYALEFKESSSGKLSQMAFGKFAARKGKLELTSGLKTLNLGKNLTNRYSRAVHKF